MKSNLLIEFLVECINEAMSRRKAGTAWSGEWHDPDDTWENPKDEERHKRTSDPLAWRAKGDKMLEDEIFELRQQPEYADLESFMQFKLDDEDFEYTTAELQAVARNIDYSKRHIKDALPTSQVIDSVKKELASLGIKFTPRQPQKHFRGSMSSMAGANRYAGNAAGSGFGSEGFTSFGRGPGAIGAGRKVNYDASDPKSLPMGSRRGLKKI